MSNVLRFWCEEAQNIRCVREEDYGSAQSELVALREELDEKGWDEMVTKLEDQNVELRERLGRVQRRNLELLDLLRDIKDAPGGSSFRGHIEAALLKPEEAKS